MVHHLSLLGVFYLNVVELVGLYSNQAYWEKHLQNCHETIGNYIPPKRQTRARTIDMNENQSDDDDDDDDEKDGNYESESEDESKIKKKKPWTSISSRFFWYRQWENEGVQQACPIPAQQV